MSEFGSILEHPQLALLSNREKQFFLCWLRAIEEDWNTKEIADKLKIDPATVAVYKSTVMRKLKISTDLRLVVFACRHEFLDIATLPLNGKKPVLPL